MTTQNIGLFKAIGAKMNYLDQRQNVLAQNVANADTPGYRPHDLEKVDFGTVLKNVTKENVVRPVTTDPRHMPAPNEVETARSPEMKKVYDVAPTGDAVVLEEQMVNANKNQIDYNLMTSMYQKNVSMIRTALGVGR
ncbi:flagellar basal body rod protein FlgB [Micavibrio aeruginosavorus]|nr:flagellar basal body rod protein FlgB [Micavibrio aeruginosavorus]